MTYPQPLSLSLCRNLFFIGQTCIGWYSAKSLTFSFVIYFTIMSALASEQRQKVASPGVEVNASHPLFKPSFIDPSKEQLVLNPNGCKMMDMIHFYLADLGVKGVKISFFRKRMPDPNMRGFTKLQGKNHYLIALAEGLEPSELRITVAHELVHVRQFEQGLIKQNEFNKDYLERSFEDEAFRLSLPMAARFYQNMDCGKTK